MVFYAQLNENNICIGVSMLNSEVNEVNMVKIESLNEEYMWKKYENNTWSTEKFEPVSTAPIDEFTELKRENEKTKQALAELTMFISKTSGGM